MSENSKNVVIRLASDCMGQGEKELGEILMTSFLNVLQEAETQPSAIVLFNTGVKLACDGSPVLEPLRDLEKNGTIFLSCGTCLDYFELKDKLEVGKVSDMFEITETMLNADLVVPI